MAKNKKEMTLARSYLKGVGSILVFFGGAWMFFFAHDTYNAFKGWLKK